MIPLASVSWEAASESDSTPDQNNGLFCPLLLALIEGMDIKIVRQRKRYRKAA